MQSNQIPANVKSVSIKQLAANGGVVQNEETSSAIENQSEEDQGVDPSWNNDISNDSLRNVWMAYAHRIEIDNPYLFSILANHIPSVVEGTVVQLGLKNQMQEAEVLKVKSQLFTFLKTQLKNAKLTLDVVWVKEDETVNKAFTASDKLKLMMEQNPSLSDLKRLFDLDLD